jgi:uncharacterized protein (DUF2141 family)
MSVTDASLLAHTGVFNAILQFSKPLKEINFDSLYFQADSLTKVPFTREDVTWDRLKNQLTIKKTMDRTLFQQAQPNGSARRPRVQQPDPAENTDDNNPTVNELNLRQSAFISIENDSSATLVQHVRPLQQPDLSVIHIEINTNQDSYFVQLLDNSQKVIREVSNQPVIRFENVIPGEYQIRMIVDLNGNGRWDPGNYFANIEPEPIVYYRSADGSTKIKGVKANWEIGAGEMFITY